MKYFIILWVCIFVVSIGCKKDDSTTSTDLDQNSTLDDGSVRISGSLGSGYSTQSKRADTDVVVDKIWALPLKEGQGGFWGSEPFVNKQVFDINDDGTFNIKIDTLKQAQVGGEDYSGDWALLLVNTSKCKDCYRDANVTCGLEDLVANKSCIVSYLALSDISSRADTAETLVKMPIENIIDNVDLGLVDKNTDGSEAVSTSSIEDNSASINISLADLQAKARTDNVFKHLQNHYINFVLGSSVQFKWTGDYSKLVSTTSRSVAELSYFGAHVNFNSADKDNAFAVAAGTPSIVAPGTIKLKPITDNAGVQTLGTEVTYNAGDSIVSNFINIDCVSQIGNCGVAMEAVFTSSFPSGWFQVKRDATTYGYYNLSLVDPFVAGDTAKSTVYMPVLKLTKDINSKITAIAVDWYQYNASTAAYEKLTDLTSLYQSIAEADDGSTKVEAGDGQYIDYAIDFQKYNDYLNPASRLSIYMKMTSEVTSLTPEWYYINVVGDTADTSKAWAGKITLRYIYAGVYFRYEWVF